MTLDAKLEAVLFWKGEPVTVKKLAQICESDEEKVSEALIVLEEKLGDRGIQLIRKEDEIMLGTHPDMSKVIEGLIKEELAKDIGKAGLETLSIVLYRGPIARKGIDFIRGVNSNFILRNLLIRGLVEKVQDPEDSRSFLYKPTFELLSYLGLNKVEMLPEYADVKREIHQHEKETQEEQIQTEHE